MALARAIPARTRRQEPMSPNSRRFRGLNKKMKHTLLICIAASMLVVGASAHPSDGSASMNDTDRNFMSTLAKAGMAEIEAGQIAAQQGSRAARVFGRQMVNEHQAASTQLRWLAAKRNVTLPSAPAPEDEVVIHRLERINDATFDAAYHHFAVLSHRQALGLFRDEIANGRDPGIKAWAQKTLPMIKEHYQEAKEL